MMVVEFEFEVEFEEVIRTAGVHACIMVSPQWPSGARVHGHIRLTVGGRLVGWLVV